MNFNQYGLDNRTPRLSTPCRASSFIRVTVSGKATLSPQLPFVNGVQVGSNGYLPGTTSPNITVPGSFGTFSASTGTGCGNCYAIPASVGPGAAPSWAAITGANPNTVSYYNNIQNPNATSWEIPGQARNSIVVTFDQKVMTDVSLFADAFYEQPPFGGIESPRRAVRRPLRRRTTAAAARCYIRQPVLPDGNALYRTLGGLRFHL